MAPKTVMPSTKSWSGKVSRSNATPNQCPPNFHPVKQHSARARHAERPDPTETILARVERRANSHRAKTAQSKTTATKLPVESSRQARKTPTSKMAMPAIRPAMRASRAAIKRLPTKVRETLRGATKNRMTTAEPPPANSRPDVTTSSLELRTRARMIQPTSQTARCRQATARATARMAAPIKSQRPTKNRQPKGNQQTVESRAASSAHPMESRPSNRAMAPSRTRRAATANPMRLLATRTNRASQDQVSNRQATKRQTSNPATSKPQVTTALTCNRPTGSRKKIPRRANRPQAKSRTQTE